MQGGSNGSRGAEPPEPPHFNHCWGYFLIVIYIDLSRTVFEKKQRFRSKIAIFPPPVYLSAPKGFFVRLLQFFFVTAVGIVKVE